MEIIIFLMLVLLFILIECLCFFIFLLEFKNTLKKYNKRNPGYAIPIPKSFKGLYSLHKSINLFIIDSRLLHYSLEQIYKHDDF